jgi:hypothetical protein
MEPLHGSPPHDYIRNWCTLNNYDADLPGSFEKILIHLGATQTDGELVAAKPFTRHADAVSAARIENCSIEGGASRRDHALLNAKSCKVVQTFGRNKFAA